MVVRGEERTASRDDRNERPPPERLGAVAIQVRIGRYVSKAEYSLQELRCRR